MTFSTASTASAFGPFPFTGTAEIPAGEWMQGSDSTRDNPRRCVYLDGFHVGVGLETVGQYRRFVLDAQEAGRYGVFGRVKVKDNQGKKGNENDEILFGRGHEPRWEAMRFFNPCVNVDVSPDDLDNAHIEEIAPELGWLEKAVSEYKLDPIFIEDDTPVTFVSQWDAYAYVVFLNQELARLRNAVAVKQIDEASLTQADRLLLTGSWFELPTAAQLQRVMAGPEGNFSFGTKDGQPLSMEGRPFLHIGPALEQSTGIPWGTQKVRHMFGTLWQRTRDYYYENSNRPSRFVIRNPRGDASRDRFVPELSGGSSWMECDQSILATAFRGYDLDANGRHFFIGLRVVRPRTP